MTERGEGNEIWSTPQPTKIALLATLAITGLAVGGVLAAAAAGELGNRTVSWFLLVFSVLFLFRVLGQVVVLLRAPRWLPPMEQWNLMPYLILLPIQIVFLAVMAWIEVDFFRGEGFFTGVASGTGWSLIGFSFVYAGSMAVRYVVRMTRRPEQRWFGGTIPIVFHVVLAAFCLTLGIRYAQ
jgi:hypothetical protein